MGKQRWSQAVLELGSWGHSVLQTPAVVIEVFFIYLLLFFFFVFWRKEEEEQKQREEEEKERKLLEDEAQRQLEMEKQRQQEQEYVFHCYSPLSKTRSINIISPSNSQIVQYSKTCVRQPSSRLTLNNDWCGKSCLSYKGISHVILLAKFTFIRQPPFHITH